MAAMSTFGGALLFLDFQPGLRHAAAAVLLFAAGLRRCGVCGRHAAVRQQIVHAQTVKVGDGLEHHDVGQGIAPLPLGHGLVGVIELRGKLGLGQVFFFSQLGKVGGERASHIIHAMSIPRRAFGRKSHVPPKSCHSPAGRIAFSQRFYRSRARRMHLKSPCRIMKS
jgi:hypothetical protein